MQEDLLAPVGYTLSVLVLLAALVMLVDVLRRKGFPGLEHGGAAVGGGVMRWVWLGLLLLALGAQANPLLTGFARSSGPPGLSVVVGEPITWRPSAEFEMLQYDSYTTTLPFYRGSHWSGEARDGRVFEASTKALVLPIWLLLVGFAYWFFVVRHARRAARPHEAAGRSGGDPGWT